MSPVLKSSSWPGRVILWASSSDMILSLNNIHVRFTLVFSWVDGSFFFIAKWYSITCVWEEKQLSIYSSRFLVEMFPVKKKQAETDRKQRKTGKQGKTDYQEKNRSLITCVPTVQRGAIQEN